ncbi:MAG: 50S ribosomal protein L3 [Cyanobacteria bacterium HKST-UBA06]|nr:50S ribosomal protein L3 [Cyanobacteria bacterium HKST-UBA04]MCA9806986.1 50S ribosomal protein L3 [Cyanobacteria bacterium HKST-UBA06]
MSDAQQTKPSNAKQTALAGAVGKKCGMTQVFSEDGSAVSVTVVELYPMTVTGVKTETKHGYSAVQVGYKNAKEKHLTKAQQGVLKKQSLGLFRKLKEFRVEAAQLQGFEVGATAKPDFLTPGKSINVTGRSIGKGFQGGTKLHNFARGPMSHGSKSHRIPGSIGPGTTPGRVYKGKRMAAHMGDDRVTVQNLTVFDYLEDKNILLVRGAVPGKPGADIVIVPRVRVGEKAPS